MVILNINDLTKGGAGARKIGGSLFVFQNKGIFKKRSSLYGGHRHGATMNRAIFCLEGVGGAATRY